MVQMLKMRLEKLREGCQVPVADLVPQGSAKSWVGRRGPPIHTGAFLDVLLVLPGVAFPGMKPNQEKLVGLCGYSKIEADCTYVSQCRCSANKLLAFLFQMVLQKIFAENIRKSEASKETVTGTITGSPNLCCQLKSRCPGD